MTIRHHTSEDPVTVIGLIYRIVDEPRRAFTLAVILLPVLASVVQITVPTAMLAGFPARAVWWSGTGALGLGWLSRAIVRLIRCKPGGAARPGKPTSGRRWQEGGRSPAGRAARRSACPGGRSCSRGINTEVARPGS